MTTSVMTCPCVAGLHEECINLIPIEGLADRFDCCCWRVETIEPLVRERGERGPYKEAHEVRDVLSTGRKRAAEVKPIEDGMLCEWAGLRFAGGGVFPIIGCIDTKIVAEKGHGARTGHIHHGPDKNTLNNDWDNLHRICSTCHNRWHTVNDPYYGDRPEGGLPFLPIGLECKPHDPETKATPEQQLKWEMYWQKKPKDREDLFSVEF